MLKFLKNKVEPDKEDTYIYIGYEKDIRDEYLELFRKYRKIIKNTLSKIEYTEDLNDKLNLFNQDYLNFIFNNKINKNRIKEAKELNNFFGRDCRTCSECYLVIFVNEIIELFTLLMFEDLTLNEESTHKEITKKAKNSADFRIKNSDVYIEFQSSYRKYLSRIEVKDYKLKQLLKYEKCYILQLKIDMENMKLFYDLIDVNTKTLENKIQKSIKTYLKFDCKTNFREYDDIIEEIKQLKKA